MGDEEQCGEDAEISRQDIPIIPETFCDVVHGDNPADSGVSLPARTIEEKTEQVWPPVIYAPIGEAKFWLEFHNGHFEYVLRQAEKAEIRALLAEARNEVLEASVEREWWEKCKLYSKLEKQEEAHQQEMKTELSKRANVIAKYIHLIYLSGIKEDRHETEVETLKADHKFVLQLALLYASNRVEEKETIIKMYEERFGSVEELLKLAAAEENSKLPGHLGPRKYVSISTLIRQHETGKPTIGKKISDFFEKILCPTTYGNIANAVYAAFRSKEPDNSCG